MAQLIQVNGLKEVTKMLKVLPMNLQKEVRGEGLTELGKLLQRMIRFRFTNAGYGRGPTSTKHTWKSIRFEKDGKIVRVTIGPEGSLIERGISSHYVSQNLIEFRKSNPNANTIGKNARKLGLAPPYSGPPVWWQYKGPFVKPALKAFRPKIGKILQKHIDKAIKKSGGKI